MKNQDEKPMISFSIRLNPQVTWRKIDRRIAVLNSETQNHYLLNELGGRIWNDIVQGKPLRDTICMIAKEYVVSRERAEQDINAFLSRLEAEKIITLEKGE
jgi:hypothetical protein